MESVFSALTPWNDIRCHLAALLRALARQWQFLAKLELVAAQIKRLIDLDRDGALFAVMQSEQSDFGVSHSIQALPG